MRFLYFDGTFPGGFKTGVKGSKTCMKKANGKPSTDGKIIKAFMAEQPITVETLHAVTGVAVKTLGKRLKVLVKMDVAKETPGGWAFKNYNSLEDSVREAMKQLLEWGTQVQSSVEIANMVNQMNPDLMGASPREVRPIAWRLASELSASIDEDRPFVRPLKRVF